MSADVLSDLLRAVRLRGALFYYIEGADPWVAEVPPARELIPAIMLMMGGVPLPGGAVLINESALKSRKWGLYVSAAGPAANFVLFLLFSIPLHPKLGLVDPYAPPDATWVHFCGAMAFLNFTAMLFNLIPVPPLDGYRLIEHRFSPEMQWKLRQPGVSIVTFGLLFLLFAAVPQVLIVFIDMFASVTDSLGLPTGLLLRGYGLIFFGS